MKQSTLPPQGCSEIANSSGGYGVSLQHRQHSDQDIPGGGWVVTAFVEISIVVCVDAQ
jgi:hypothetical protein